MGNHGGYGPPPEYGPPPPAAMAYVPPMPMAGYSCPFCMYQGPAMMKQRISTGGWIVFAVLMFVCLPLFWIGLLMKETVPACPQCGRP